MSPDLSKSVTFSWAMLTEVPGWPNAPWPQRLRRAIPVIFPLVTLVAIMGWMYGIQKPDMERRTRESASLIALEGEVSSLGLHTSESQAREVAEQASAAHALLVSDAEQRARLLQVLQQRAVEAGWTATFQSGETPVVFDTHHFANLSIRATFKPAPGNNRPLGSLLTYLEDLTQAPKRIDLIRLGIRADEQGWHSVEAGLLLAVPIPNAKMAQ